MKAKRRRASSGPREQASRFPVKLTSERIFVGGSVLLSVIIVGVIVVISARNRGIQTADIEGVETFPVASATHVTTHVNYPQTPPVGGPHNPTWQDCGVYTEPLVNEFAVHSLEHGAVWITYQPDLPADQVQTLQDIARGGTHRLLSPYPGIDSPVIVTAWGLQLRLPDANDSRLMDFVRKYENGPQTPEPGAPCSGGESRSLSQLQGQ